MARFDITMKGWTMVYSGAINLCRDEVGLASNLSQTLAIHLGEYKSEVLSHKIFYAALCIPGINFVVSSVL
jgi:hypothetical protein